jgi:hypothetical protein
MGRLFGRPEREREQRDELLSAYLDGELSAEEQARLGAQLAADPALQAELEALRRTVALVRELPPVRIPRNFVLPPTRAARPRSAPSARPRRAWTAPLLTAATAVVSLMFVAILAGDLLLSGAGQLAPEPAAQMAESETLPEAPAPAAVVEPGAIEVTVAVEAEVPAEETLRLGTTPTDTLLPMPAEPPPDAAPATDVPEGYAIETSQDMSGTVPAMGGGGPAIEPTAAPHTPIVEEQAEDEWTIPPAATGIPGTDEGDLELTPREVEVPPPQQAMGEAEPETLGAMPGAPESETRKEYSQPPAVTVPWRTLEVFLGLTALGLALATIWAWRALGR